MSLSLSPRDHRSEVDEGATCPLRASQSVVESQQWHVEQLGERDVRRVVGGDLATEFPDAIDERSEADLGGLDSGQRRWLAVDLGGHRLLLCTGAGGGARNL